MKLLVCGGRDFLDWPALYRELDELHSVEPITLLIEGGATGADRLARRWADMRSVPVKTVGAEWDKFGRAAGMIRNGAMLNERPDMVCAFPGGRGTADMVKQARERGVPIFVPTL